MGRNVVRGGIARAGAGLVIVLVLVAACSNTRPTPDAFDETTTTSVLAGGEVVTTTSPTLPPPEDRVVASVISVTDGDTITVRIDGEDRDLRLLGINAPETSECWGPESSIHLSEMIDGQDLLLISGEEDTDQFGRLLRYVYLDTPGGPVFVNSEMVEAGNALGMSSGHDYDRSFKSLEAAAFQSGLGMWGTFVCGDAEGISADRPVVRVSEIQFDPRGPDNENLDEEYVTIVNQGYGRVSLSGWVLRDESSSNRMTFPQGIVLAPGDSVTVITGCDGGPVAAIHWCNDGAVWSNQGDTVIVSDTLGNVVIRHAYTGEDAR
jgi:endonuclease YncB( thermonuclease family)